MYEHLASMTYAHVATTKVGAEALRDVAKTAKYASSDPNGYAFIPLCIEPYG